MALRTRLAGLIGSGALLAGALVGVGSTPASAAGVTFGFNPYPDGGGRIYAQEDGNYLGDVTWYADGDATHAEDTLCALDAWPDGRYVRGYASFVRTVDTSGLTSPSTRCQGGDMNKGQKFTLQMCLVAVGSTPVCSEEYDVTT
ncbi:hypothetical protein AV521_05275 [Streptomyces sp. IMTB 2501]|uniref:hypothetical protein n=1 Tax=Streptomyces sp. IMTB 2501 TaxID=1776340 RepID=UPI00096D1E3B|nr:hypothetical protein [Streptomyces sp. IMTB 2501]OLZ73477.1 hypothetical protein AV521_05275 [Streptomyces sp. IMTB 2501]